MQECKVFVQGLDQNTCKLKADIVIIARREMRQRIGEKLGGYWNKFKGWGAGDKNKN